MINMPSNLPFILSFQLEKKFKYLKILGFGYGYGYKKFLGFCYGLGIYGISFLLCTLHRASSKMKSATWLFNLKKS
jgi:hypothetical protein